MEQQELTLEQMDLSPDPARADAYVPFAEKPEKRRGLFGRKAEPRTVTETRRGRIESPVAVAAMPEHAQGPKEGKEQVASHRTKLEVPVIFPSTPQPSRHSRKVEGTATDIRIRRDADETDTVYQESRQPTAKPEVPERSKLRCDLWKGRASAVESCAGKDGAVCIISCGYE